ncbi:DUF4923 family protein [Prevotella copri]|jgi:hypothetical protein|uniref:DUF4923 family protein n=1 Tax=Segatella copri TaxID=165179 RepID=A0AAW5IT07_9BACT|nr:DUF4923 family protein [Segatella copri]MCP9553265.1 DUF4923 family protein [Segatella copri]MCP9574020.1 DUF4923 family protein [Segatella copri]MCP9577028.1 DUF4923 family protein [Segatella copri]MCP9579905.1 DUF4923 family protein [Segatella copri]MCP9582834.1 DUF4923 family protein [Segatella copri]
MKKVFLLAALVLACTAGSNASAMNEAALNASMSEMMPVKKTTKKTTKKTSKKTSKKTTNKKTSTKKTTSAASNTTAATTTTAAATTSNSATSTSTTSNAGSAIAGILGAVMGGSSNSSSSAGSSIINGILNNVIGSGTFSKQDLCAHTWKYSKPGCAFTSENLLAQAGGEIAANKVEEKLGEYYSKFGFSGSNTYFTFNTDGTFAAKIDGKSWQGNYTFDEKTHAIQMKGLILSMSGYATKTANGISLLFDQKKLLNLIKTIGSLKGSSTLSALGTIANNYDGMRVGFEMTK